MSLNHCHIIQKIRHILNKAILPQSYEIKTNNFYKTLLSFFSFHNMELCLDIPRLYFLFNLIDCFLLALPIHFYSILLLVSILPISIYKLLHGLLFQFFLLIKFCLIFKFHWKFSKYHILHFIILKFLKQ